MNLFYFFSRIPLFLVLALIPLVLLLHLKHLYLSVNLFSPILLIPALLISYVLLSLVVFHCPILLLVLWLRLQGLYVPVRSPPLVFYFLPPPPPGVVDMHLGMGRSLLIPFGILAHMWLAMYHIPISLSPKVT